MRRDAKERARAWVKFLSGFPATHAVTLAYNPEATATVSLDRIRADLDKLHLYVDVGLHGRHVTDWPEERRCAFVGFVEHPDTNAHVHMLWRVPAVHQDEFEQVLDATWARIHQPGSLDVKPNPNAGWAKYVCKDQWGATLDGDPALFVASRTAKP